LWGDETDPSKAQLLNLPVKEGNYSIDTPCVKKPIAVLPGVYLGVWKDTTELCSAIDVKPKADVLDIGTGNGILAITALERGARFAVATDINPKAVENARLNAKLYHVSEKLDVRLVPEDDSGAFSVIRKDERFDLIICNCPALDADVDSFDEANAFDPGHMLVISLFKGLKEHLKPGGRLLMTYWSGAGIDLLRKLADQNDLQLNVLKTFFNPDQVPYSPQPLNRKELYKIPMGKVKDTITGEEKTLIVEITPRQYN
jgi:release factor glutamine methyltransferase